MRNDRKNLIVDLSFSFALDIIKFCDDLVELKRYKLSDQLFKSGTSIGANIREAQNAESKADFIHKIKIAAKEADETQYWLLLTHHSGIKNSIEMMEKLEEIIKITSKIISTSKSK